MSEQHEPSDYSLQSAYRAAYLLAGFVRQTLTSSEMDELDDWVSASPANQRVFEDITSETSRQASLQRLDNYRTEEALIHIKEKLGISARPPVRRLTYWMAAASVLLALGVGYYLYVHNRKLTDTNDRTMAALPADIAPGSSQAVLTLDNGTQITLSGQSMDTVLQGGIHLQNQNGALAYQAASHNSPDTGFHTLTVPRKGEYQLILPDGTKVWLNAGSSIRYPVAFNGPTRNVTLVGEAYFEVAKNPKQPFIASTATSQTRVTGTHFNLSAYSDDSLGSTTLLEGSVIISSAEGAAPLKPGQQSQVDKHGHITVRSDADTSAIVAWKNGLFTFHKAPLSVVLAQISRWYDVQLVSKETIDPAHTFTGEIARTKPISQILELIHQTGIASFTIDKTTITVNPWKP
ncbi:MAG TPA: FecR domain-containing protein [Chitinophagaceae bacterium]|jgi:ferric-dicitrate binding protein FerR (iron transport regulator)